MSDSTPEPREEKRMEYVKPKRIWIREHPQLDERWVQQRIAEDPAILGLGDLILKDRERKFWRMSLNFQQISMR